MADIEFSQEELIQLATVFKALRVKPKMDTADDMVKWMTDYISSLKSGLSQQVYGYIPKLPYFGDDGKGSSTYEVWRYHVRCLIQEGIQPEVIAQAIRTSLKGEAGTVVMRLGTSVSISSFIDKMDGVYGDVKQQEDILAEFFSAKQQQHEDVTHWGLRLESLLNNASSKGKMHWTDTDKSLRSVFYHGLKSTKMMNIGRYKFDSTSSFNDLLVAIRQIEQELNQREDDDTKQKPIPKERTSKIKKEVQQVSVKLDGIEEQMEQQQIFNTYQPLMQNKPLIRCWRCGQQGHIAVGCSVRLDHAKRGQLLQQTISTKDAYGISRKQLNMRTNDTQSNLVGKATESSIYLNGIRTESLLDTGSTVSTISKEYYDRCLSETPIQPLKHFIEIECADGKQLPYLGYVNAEVEIEGVPVEPMNTLFLVVPSSKYHSTVPVLLGTNILSALMASTKEHHGTRFLQKANLHTPWYLAFRCMALREKELEKSNNRLAIVRSAEHKRVVIKPNSSVTVQGFLTKELEYQPVCTMLQPTSSAAIPDDLDITPTVVNYQYHQLKSIPVQINNVTTRTVVIDPNATLCELQPVNIMDVPQTETLHIKQQDNYLDDVKISSSLLDETQQREVKAFLQQLYLALWTS